MPTSLHPRPHNESPILERQATSAGSSLTCLCFLAAKYIVQVDGKIGLFRGLSPRLMSNALSTVTRGSMKKVSHGLKQEPLSGLPEAGALVPLLPWDCLATPWHHSQAPVPVCPRPSPTPTKSFPLLCISQVFPPDEMEQVSNKDDMKTSLRKVVKEVSVRISGTPALPGAGWATAVISGRTLQSLSATWGLCPSSTGADM